MFPLTVITWRLGILDSDIYEPLILDADNVQDLFQEIYELTQGVFYLSTCQRIVLVVENTEEWLVDEIIDRYFKLCGIEDTGDVYPEIIFGIDGLLHLSKVISGLDSAVLGEYEIQRQFKEAYNQSKNYLGTNLNTYLQYIIRIGKRVRSEIQLHKASTVEAVVSMIPKEVETARSMGLIGTGKMGRIILEYFKDNLDRLTLYTTHENRVDSELKGLEIKHIDELEYHDIVFTATAKAKLITKEFVEEKFPHQSLYLVDLGMPRNCDPSIDRIPNINLIDIEKLVHQSRSVQISPEISRAIDIIESEVDKIIENYQSQLKSSIIIGLRTELNEFAECRKAEFKGKAVSEKEYQQFVNSMIHISQKYLEKIIFGK